MKIDGGEIGGTVQRLVALALLLLASLIATATPALAVTGIRPVYYSYDIMGRQKTATFDSTTGADGITNSYNGFGELTSTTLAMGTFSKTIGETYNVALNRKQITHPDGQVFSYCYDALSRLTTVAQGTDCTTNQPRGLKASCSSCMNRSRFGCVSGEASSKSTQMPANLFCST